MDDVKHLRRKDIWSRLDTCEMGNATLPNCYAFPYLGVHNTGDGRTTHELHLRKAKASERFSSLMEVWKDDSLNSSLKLELYRSLVISTFVYGHEAWLLNTTTLKMINGFNSRCLAVITDREIRDEAVDPSFDLCMYLRSQRLSHLGHILRMDPAEPVRAVVCSRGLAHRVGDLFMDAPEHSSIEDLTELAFDRDRWRDYVRQLAGEGSGGTVRANSAADTQQLVDALPSNSILAYTDGGCDGNGAGGYWGKAGWGAWICRKQVLTQSSPEWHPPMATNSTDFVALSDLWGPVVTKTEDEFYCECTIGTNNTGELCGMLNALLWARRQGGHETFAICYDSMYARNVTGGIWKPKANKGISALCYKAFCAENARRKGGVTFIHVKGHSGNGGNDKADDRVQWGKGDGPYCRFRPNGTCEGISVDYPYIINVPPPSPTSNIVHPSPSQRMRSAAQSTFKAFTSNLSTIRRRDVTTSPETTMSSTRSSSSPTFDLSANATNEARNYNPEHPQPPSARRALDFSLSNFQAITTEPIVTHASPVPPAIDWDTLSTSSTRSMIGTLSSTQVSILDDNTLHSSIVKQTSRSGRWRKPSASNALNGRKHKYFTRHSNNTG